MRLISPSIPCAPMLAKTGSPMGGGPLWRRLWGCGRGAMMLEFAVALPVLLALYSGTYTLGDMIACQHKVTAATRQLTDLVARANTLDPAELSGILAASAQVLAPYAGARATITVSEIEASPNGAATVVWSQSLNGTALDTGAPVPLPPATASSMARGCGVMILGQVRYAYQPTISLGPAQTVSLSDAMVMRPHDGPQVILTGARTATPCA